MRGLGVIHWENPFRYLLCKKTVLLPTCVAYHDRVSRCLFEPASSDNHIHASTKGRRHPRRYQGIIGFLLSPMTQSNWTVLSILRALRTLLASFARRPCLFLFLIDSWAHGDFRATLDVSFAALHSTRLYEFQASLYHS